MSDPFVFHDLVGPERQPNEGEEAWLSALATELEPDEYVVPVAPSCVSTEPGPVLQRDAEGWRAGRYVGEIRRDGRVLEIRPRLGIEILASWAAAALNLRVVPLAGEQRGTSVLIAELMAATWRSAVVEAARHGLPGFRHDLRREGLFVRGRLDVSGTLRLRARGAAAVASVDRPKVIDNAVARSIVLADRVLDRRIGRADWRGERVEEIIAQLRAQTGSRPELPRRRELESVRFAPITLPYRRAGRLSWEIARHRGLRSSAESEEAEGLLIDVAELWELFVLHCCRRAFGHTRVLHGTSLDSGQHLLHNEAGTRWGRLYPDVIVGPDGDPEIIIDAKYKPLAGGRGVDREDLYQLTTYLLAHEGSPSGLLAYPDLPDASEPPWQEQGGPWSTSDGHKLQFVRLPLAEDECVGRLEGLVESPGHPHSPSASVRLRF